MLVLDANDLQLALCRDGAVLYAEPGAALIGPKRVVFGRDALAQSRLQPRQSHNEFWHKLNADAVAPPGPGVANQADLVYLQLAAMRAAAGMRRRADLIVAAPSGTSESQLALLLGIAAEAGFDIRAVVDAAVAAASQWGPAAAVKVVDVGLHGAVVTELEVAAGSDGTPQLRRQTVQEVAAAGFAKLLEGWVDAVADRFVEATRFDPLRLAATEQQVFDQVRAGLAKDADATVVEIRHEGSTRQVEATKTAFAQKSAQRYDLLLDALGGPADVALMHQASRLPGLAERLGSAGHRATVLPAGAPAAAIAAQAAAIPLAAAGERVRFVTALPARGAAAPAVPPPRATPATHLLCGGIAVPLAALEDASEHPGCAGTRPLFRLREAAGGFEALPGAEVPATVGGEPLAGPRLLAAGDALDCGGFAFALIAVQDAPGRG